MPVDSKHALYVARETEWQRIRDTVAGERAVKDRGTEYVPKLESQDPQQYSAYLERGFFFEAASRTVEGLVGAVLLREPTITFPDEDLLEQLGAASEPFSEIEKQTLFQCVSMGRFALLVDAPEDMENGEEPFVAAYQAESVINWREEIVDGRRELVRLHLHEMVAEPDPKDEFVEVRVEQVRVLYLGMPIPRTREESAMPLEEFLAGYGLVVSDFEKGPVYWVELWRPNTQATTERDRWSKVRTMVPRKKGGAVFHRIPVVVFNSTNLELSPEKSPILSLVNANLSHFRNSVDMEHGLHFTALPTAWAAGFDDSLNYKVGGEVAWVSENPSAQAGYLEFTGAGLGALRTQMDRKEALMAVLGARLLEEPKAGVEAAEAIKLRTAGEKSVLCTITETVSAGLTKVLRYVQEWLGNANPDAAVELNQDFTSFALDPSMLKELVAAVQAGTMSWPTMFWNLKRGGLVPESIEEEDEAARIAEGWPGMAAPPATEDPEDDETEGEGEKEGGEDGRDR